MISGCQHIPAEDSQKKTSSTPNKIYDVSCDVNPYKDDCEEAIKSGDEAKAQSKKELHIKKSLKGYSSITVKIIASPEVMNSANYNKVKEKLLDTIAGEITSKTRLQYSLSDNATDLSLNIEVKNLEYTSQGSRIMFGILSGKAVLNTELSLFDNKTDEILWKVHADESSKMSGGIFGDSTASQIKSISDQIIILLQESK